MSTIKNVIHEKSQRMFELEGRHPWFPIAYRFAVAFLLVAMLASIAVHAVQVKAAENERIRQESLYAERQAKQAALEAEQAAALEAEQKAIRERMEYETTLLTKVLVGINNFVEKYSYSDGDIRTYGECVINRVLNQGNGFGSSIEEVILQENQWTGFSESNQSILRYELIAKSIIEDYYNRVTRPCSSDYCWAELRRDGVYLKNAFSDSAYVRTWRY